jgi:hypothetical protein
MTKRVRTHPRTGAGSFNISAVGDGATVPVP